MDSASLYQPIFTFAQPQFKQNKLIDKMVPAVEVDASGSIVRCKDGDAQVAIVRAQYPLQTNSIVAYFQVEIQKCSTGRANQCGLNIGLVTKDGNPRAYAGKYMNSIGYINGQIYLNKKKVATGPHFSKKDRVGCGINCLNMSFFFTKNTQLVASNITLHQGNKWNQFYPAVALQHQDETIKCHFEKKDFVFDIQDLAKQIQEQVKEQIFHQESDHNEINSSQIYSLISEYMLFNGYSKTLEMMKNKKEEIQFEPINKLTKNIHGTKVLIDLDQTNSKKNQSEYLQNYEAISQQGSDRQKKQLKQSIIEQLIAEQPRIKSRMRQRIMSDVHPQMLQQEDCMQEQSIQPRRKNTEAFGQQDISNYQMRKQSNISNISLIDQESMHVKNEVIQTNGNNKQKISEATVFQQSLSKNERFLLNQRLQILSCLKQGKIEYAEKIIKAIIPQLYEIQPLLEAYMKAHIFLRKIKEESAIAAMTYCRAQTSIQNNIEKLFPTYNEQSGNIEMVPMKKILTSIVKDKNSEKRKFLQKEQFECFAEFINTLIMKSMGVMGNSRLGVIIEHTSIVLRKLQEFKGMSCGVKLLN